MRKLSTRLGAVLAVIAAAPLMNSSLDAAESGLTGRIGVEVRNVRVERSANAFRFIHDRAFLETGGVGVTLTQGQVCFSNGQCQGKPVQYRIEANREFVFHNAEVEPLGANETFAYIYTGKDDNGHVVETKFRIVVSDDRFLVTP